ncbi:LytTR family transcriptional regulator DNA-binding domain-containing protein [Oenococcus oeni]|uniref:Response regulator n=2 Tax=Oenococcus oeni TaxID=1247 RepID=A0A6H3GTJ0_OENOE|nr:LytTR family transcriptional regulator DNA-binding domain-containing protein [Oenococcus oeni]EAV39768.1 two-component response regulator [Oenococcus oeni ATCC BAA-1163]AVI94035.1 two-component system response regulator [Oenococcus oeni]EJO01869.1 response regulator [Oenococcus oeni AWRIB418]KDE87065.1 chemotaxis protein CheY [Oenococcus oeni]KEP87682.1 chemotaxis protein CheY [Oenococcus oeni IOEB_0501]
MKILVVDDEPLARDELSYLLKQNRLTDSVYQADSIGTAVDKLLQEKIDVIFIDISLNDENGFQLANELKKLIQPPLIVFATAFDSYAVKAFDVDAVDYVLKPFEQSRVNQALEKVQAIFKLQAKKDNSLTVNSHFGSEKTKIISITSDDKTKIIKQHDLIMATIKDGALTLITNGQSYSTRQSLGWLLSRLNKNDFLQVHRSIIVNINSISELEPWFNHTYQLKLTNGMKVPVSRSFIKSVKKRLMM